MGYLYSVKVMAHEHEVQLADIVDSKDSQRVLDEVHKIFSLHYADGLFGRIEADFKLVRSVYAGDFPGYRACLAGYHDINHVMDIFLATARLVDGYNLRGLLLPEEMAGQLLLATLLHDIGYIQEDWDTEGTGAKYSRDHEERGITFMTRNAAALEIDDNEFESIAGFIHSTDLKLKFETLPFSVEQERHAGALLGTADLLGQMADRAYLEKLLFLYYEFREAGIPGYDTEFDILRKTRDFYEVTRHLLEESYLNMAELAHPHFLKRYAIDSNLYMVAIDRQMAYLDSIIADETTNFRTKLHRGDQEKLQQGVAIA